MVNGSPPKRFLGVQIPPPLHLLIDSFFLLCHTVAMRKKHIILLIILLVVGTICIIGFLKYTRTSSLPQKLTLVQYNQATQTPIDAWKTYTNKTYGFTLDYPAVGYAQDASCFEAGKPCEGVHITSCGSDIKQDKLGDTPYIGVDNFFGILINTFDGTLNEYITKNAGGITYVTQPIIVAGADEALYIKGQRGTSNSIPNIMYPAYVIKKDNNIFSITNLQNPGSKTGCLPPAGTKGSVFDAKYWNIPESLTFQ